jgi:transcriptional regulator with XRE-family HTH domain
VLGERIKKLRKEKKLTQQELGEKVNVTKVSISGYENGNRTPDTETLQKLADVLETSTDYLLGRTDEPSLVKDEKAPYNTGTENNSYEEQPEIHLTPDELKILREIKKHPVLFHDLANAPEKKIKQLIKMWNFIKQDLEEDDEELEGFGDIKD